MKTTIGVYTFVILCLLLLLVLPASGQTTTETSKLSSSYEGPQISQQFSTVSVDFKVVEMNLSPEGQFEPGRAVMSEELVRKLSYVNWYQNFDVLLVVGTDDSDAAVAELRSEVVSKWILQITRLKPYLIEQRSLLTENRRGVKLVFVSFKVTPEDLTELTKYVNEALKLIIKNQKRINDLARDITDLHERDEKLATKISQLAAKTSQLENDDKTFLGLHLGLKGSYVTEKFIPSIELGMSYGHLEIAAWLGYRPDAGTVTYKVSNTSFTKDIRYITYGVRFAYYLLELNNYLNLESVKLDLGPFIGLEHIETVLQDQKQYVSAEELALVGLSLDIGLTRRIILNIAGSAAFAWKYKSDFFSNNRDVQFRIAATLEVVFN